MASTPKKYLSLEETAARLSVSRDQLIRMRENGEIRGFADRGTWKFRLEDVDEFARSRQSDSEPDVQMHGDSGPMVIGDEVADSGSSTVLSGREDVGDEPTVIRKGDAGAASDSDVKLVGADSDSDITLAPGGDPAGSDSDVKLIPDEAADDSDSDVQLIDPTAAGEDSSDSDVALIGGSDSTVALDMPSDDSEQASVLSDDSGLALDSGSSLTLAADSGISLESRRRHFARRRQRHLPGRHRGQRNLAGRQQRVRRNGSDDGRGSGSGRRRRNEVRDSGGPG